MSLEDLRLAYTLVEGWECFECGTPFEIQRLVLEPSPNDIDFEAEYNCPGCVGDYEIEVTVYDDRLNAQASRLDIETLDELNWDMSSTSRRAALYEKAHPSRDLVEALRNLYEAVGLLSVNKDRVLEAHDELQEIDNLADESLDSQPIVETHNYLSSSYSFSQILDTIKPDLPIGNPVESAMDSYNEQNKVISGLRIYSQHHLIPSLGFTTYYNQEIEEERLSFTIDLEEVLVNDSGLSKYEDDGYKHGANHHYGNIEGDLIDLPLRIERHYESVEDLLVVIRNYVNETKGSELEDYQEKTRFKSS